MKYIYKNSEMTWCEVKIGPETFVYPHRKRKPHFIEFMKKRITNPEKIEELLEKRYIGNDIHYIKINMKFCEVIIGARSNKKDIHSLKDTIRKELKYYNLKSWVVTWCTKSQYGYYKQRDSFKIH